MESADEASFEPCLETAFSPEAYPVFLEAEHAMFERREPRRTAELLDQLALRGLSCFEHFPVTILRTNAELAIRDPEFIYGENYARPRLMPVFDLSIHPIAYPPAAEAAGIEGDCSVTFDAARTGETRRVRASCTDPLLVATAEDHVRRSRFEPVTERGRAVEVPGAQLRFAFRLEPQDAEEVAAYDRFVTTRR
ncbi:energy transducer TonB [Hyphomonas sp.]|uniref:energy transducer TonB n=1 Tax=Hyphomonas sp. TaxID=87 RepID=UPI003918F475